MSRISLGSLSSNFCTGAKTVGRVGTWPVRKSGRAMKAAGSGSANAARSFVRTFDDRRFKDWAVKRDEATLAKKVETTKQKLNLLMPSGAAFAFANALADGDIGTAAGAMALLREKCAEPVQGVTLSEQEIAAKMNSEIKGAVGKLKEDQQKKLSNLSLDDVATKISKSAGIPQDEVKNILKKVQDRSIISTAQNIAGNVLNISEQGEVTGTFTDVNSSAVDYKSSSHSFISYFEKKGQNKLSEDGANFVTENGVKLLSATNEDLFRIHIDIGGYDTYLNGDSSQIPEKKRQNAAKLREFAGSDEAATVLSSVLHQYFLRDTVRGSRAASGAEIAYRLVPNGYNDVRVYKSDGTYDSFSTKNQLADATISVTKNKEGNFHVKLGLTMLANRLYDETTETELAINPENPTSVPSQGDAIADEPCTAFKVQTDGYLIVSALDANNGELKVLDGQFSQTVSGMIQRPQ